MRKLGLAMMVLAFSGSVAAAEVYRWTDQDGRVHYGDKPTSNSQKLEIEPASGSGGDAAKAAQTQAQSQQDADKKAALCKQKQSELGTYQKSARLIERDNLGNEHEYTAEERKKLIDRTQQAVKDSCG